MSDLLKLTKPFPDGVVKEKPGSYKASYVSHSEVTQSLLGILGPYSTEVKQVIRGSDNSVEGIVLALKVVVDGKEIVVEEAGAVERKVPNSGEALKDCFSDAIKRCAMRLGLGLHLWAGDSYYLYNILNKREQEKEETTDE